MQVAVEEPAQGSWVKADGFRHRFDLKTKFAESKLPLLLGPVMMRQSDSETSIADAIHEPKCWGSEEPPEPMILDDEMMACDARRLGQESGWIFSMMENVNK